MRGHLGLIDLMLAVLSNLVLLVLVSVFPDGSSVSRRSQATEVQMFSGARPNRFPPVDSKIALLLRL